MNNFIKEQRKQGDSIEILRGKVVASTGVNEYIQKQIETVPSRNAIVNGKQPDCEQRVHKRYIRTSQDDPHNHAGISEAYQIYQVRRDKLNSDIINKAEENNSEKPDEVAGEKRKDLHSKKKSSKCNLSKLTLMLSRVYG